MEPPNLPAIRALRPAWNKGQIVGQKHPLKPKHVWAVRVRLELAENNRDLALFNMAIDRKLRGRDLVKLESCRCHGVWPDQGESVGATKQNAKTIALRNF